MRFSPQADFHTVFPKMGAMRQDSPLSEFSAAEPPNAVVGWFRRLFAPSRDEEGCPDVWLRSVLAALVEPCSCHYVTLYLYSTTEGFRPICRPFSQAKALPMFKDISLRAF